MFVVAAGVLESLSAMAHAHLELGIASPFLVSMPTVFPFICYKYLKFCCPSTLHDHIHFLLLNAYEQPCVK